MRMVGQLSQFGLRLDKIMMVWLGRETRHLASLFSPLFLTQKESLL
jgi:hypothetical protein